MSKTIRAIYFDLETTGVRTEQDRIVEIAAYDPEREQAFVHLINPGVPIPPDSSAIHHITDEMVKDSPAFGEIIASFVEFCGPDAVLIAHNGDSFDIPFLKAECKRNGATLPAWPSIDTLKWARKYRPDLPRHTLQYLRETYQIPANQAHRALDDVKIMHQVFSLLIDDLPMAAVLKLLSETKKPGSLTHMPFGKHQGKPLSEIPKSYVAWLAKSGAFDKTENSALKECFEKLNLLTT